MLIDHLGELLCVACDSDDRCFACLRTLGGAADRKANTLYDDRRRCARCSTGAIENDDGLELAVPDVRENLRSVGVVAANRTRVTLRPYAELQTRQSGLLGYTVIQTGSHEPVRAINVADGLPMTLFGCVLAHEIAHAWLAGIPEARSAVEEEGLCELVAAWWLGHRGGRLSAYLLRAKNENPDPIYGGGYRRAASLAGRKPPRAVVDLVSAGLWRTASQDEACGR